MADSNSINLLTYEDNGYHCARALCHDRELAHVKSRVSLENALYLLAQQLLSKIASATDTLTNVKG